MSVVMDLEPDTLAVGMPRSTIPVPASVYHTFAEGVAGFPAAGLIGSSQAVTPNVTATTAARK
jgi:hypothetical protein